MPLSSSIDFTEGEFYDLRSAGSDVYTKYRRITARLSHTAASLKFGLGPYCEHVSRVSSL